ncbi:MAG: hypothetical protein U9R17_19260 [Thermodesulfobacteriota bacterium]|nr:hypothetical protein [Thermodesulfobacteriota bacterium]
MTVCVAVKVSEGLVLAADSTAAIQGNIHDPAGGKPAPGILKTYHNVRKLSHIKDYPIGTLTWGSALIGSRSVESLIKEYEHNLSSLEEESQKAKQRRIRDEEKNNHSFKYNVKDTAQGLLEHIKNFYDTEFKNLERSKQPLIGILVNGYSSGKFFPEQWLIELPRLESLEGVRPDKDGKPLFGANWYGLTDAITRLHWGRDDAAIDILAKHFNKKPSEIFELLKRLQYPVLFDGMPLQDAIDYAVYLVSLTIGRYRFVAGAPLCGGEIDVAVITPNSFSWVQRKSWKVKRELGE